MPFRLGGKPTSLRGMCSSAMVSLESALLCRRWQSDATGVHTLKHTYVAGTRSEESLGASQKALCSSDLPTTQNSWVLISLQFSILPSEFHRTAGPPSEKQLLLLWTENLDRFWGGKDHHWEPQKIWKNKKIRNSSVWKFPNLLSDFLLVNFRRKMGQTWKNNLQRSYW